MNCARFSLADNIPLTQWKCTFVIARFCVGASVNHKKENRIFKHSIQSDCSRIHRIVNTHGRDSFCYIFMTVHSQKGPFHSLSTSQINHCRYLVEWNDLQQLNIIGSNLYAGTAYYGGRLCFSDILTG